MHILLVDDDTELPLLSEFLRRRASPSIRQEGLRSCSRLRPPLDLVVLGVMLPGIDGFEILRRLRATSKVRS